MILSCIGRRASNLSNALIASKHKPRAAVSLLQDIHKVTLTHRASTRHSSSQSREDARRTKPKQGSIRPITVFAICIPLGYGLNWVLKRRHEAAADTDGFVKYSLISKEDISSTCSIFTLAPTTSSNIRTDDPASRRAVTSVQFKQPQLQIARSYTLLPASGSQDPHELRFLIRKERNGEVSGYLHRLPLGSEIELRGLQAEYVLPEKVDKVVFLAGGTGIAPAMQVAGILAGEADVHILLANRRREDCLGGRSDTARAAGRGWAGFGWRSSFVLPSSGADNRVVAEDQAQGAIVSQLNGLKHVGAPGRAGRLFVDYFVDKEATFITTGDVERLIRSSTDSGAESKLLFVAGPDGFINHWAGNKEWVNGQEVQGPLRGALTTLNLDGWEVVKL